MPGIVCVGDLCSGHPPFPPRTVSINQNTKVTIGNKPIVVVGDTWELHCGSGCHIGVSAVGYNKITIAGKPVVIAGLPITCGSFTDQASTSVSVG